MDTYDFENEMSKTIEIENLEVIQCKIVIRILLRGENYNITAKVSENVKQFITTDRCDAIVVGLLHFAMEYGYDIKSSIPISEDLYYRLQFHFIDAIANEKSNLYRTKLILKTIPCCEHIGNIVATGISCGIDCLYTLKENSCPEIPTHKITHLAFYDVGSHYRSGGEKDIHIFNGRKELCKRFADEYGYVFYTVESDIYKFLAKNGGYSHLSNHSYMAAFCILLLQKGINKYYYSATYPYYKFRINKNRTLEDMDSALYDLLTFNTISFGGLNVYSSGGAVPRIEKTKELVNYEPAQKYLNVCVEEVSNDGTCFKCIRTLLSLDALGNINDFARVFDIDHYKKHKKEFIQKMWICSTFYHDELYKEILPYYKDQLTMLFKINAICNKMCSVVHDCLHIR